MVDTTPISQAGEMANVVSTISSPEFLALWKEVNDRPLSWDEFRALAMPQDIDPCDLWFALSILRKQVGVKLPFHCYRKGFSSDDEVWFSVTKQQQRNLRFLEEQTSETSWFSYAIGKYMTSQLEIGLVLPEIIACLEQDGVGIDRERASALIAHKTQPSNAEDFVLLRVVSTYAGVSEGRRVGRGLIEDVFDSIAQQDGLDQVFPAAERSSNKQTEGLATASNVLDVYCELHASGLPYDAHGDILSCIEGSVLVSDLAPLPAFNACVDLIVRKHHYLRSSIAAAIFIPFWSALGDFEQQARNDSAQLDALYPTTSTALGMDKTAAQGRQIARMKTAFEAIMDSFTGYIEQTEHILNGVKASSLLNDRQKRLLDFLVRKPSSLISVGKHCEREHVAYATGRSDIMKLVDRGVLRQIQLDNGYAYLLDPAHLDCDG